MLAPPKIVPPPTTEVPVPLTVAVPELTVIVCAGAGRAQSRREPARKSVGREIRRDAVGVLSP